MPAPAHMPERHVSGSVPALPSLHVAPSPLFGFEQMPVPVSHVPATWHWSTGEHVTGLLPLHLPASHLSVCVHLSPSVQVAPSLPAVKTQPVAPSHESTVHGLLSSQVMSAPLHRPLAQLSESVHLLPSSHLAPSLPGDVVQPVCALQPSIVHGLRSSQILVVPAQTLPTQVS